MMSRGMIYNMLSNPIYIGQIRHKKTVYAGEHESIISQEMWNNVQQHIAANRNNNKDRPRKFDRSPLINKLFTSFGEKLIPSYANKNGKRYRYYISQGFKNDIAANNRHGWRLPAQEIEAVVANAAILILNDAAVITDALQKSGIAAHYIPDVIASVKKIQLEHIIDNLVQKVELSREGISIVIGLGSFIELPELREVRISKDIPMLIKRRGAEMRLIIGGDVPARIDKALIKAIAQAHLWLNQLITGQVQNIAEIGSNEGIDKSNVIKIINLAFLSPIITEKIIAGRQAADITVRKLTRQIDIPLDWFQQSQTLDFI
jgi:site-specific DNA recombinase